MGRKKEDLAAKFFRRVVSREAGKCWLWAGPPGNNGYGQFYLNGRNLTAHCASYFIHNGKFPDPGLIILHTCDVKLCVNPDHLVAGTHKQNSIDLFTRRPPDWRGEGNGRAKLTNEMVTYARENHIPYDKKMSISALARSFGVDQSVLSRAVHRKKWRHI